MIYPVEGLCIVDEADIYFLVDLVASILLYFCEYVDALSILQRL